MVSFNAINSWMPYKPTAGFEGARTRPPARQRLHICLLYHNVVDKCGNTGNMPVRLFVGTEDIDRCMPRGPLRAPEELTSMHVPLLERMQQFIQFNVVPMLERAYTLSFPMEPPPPIRCVAHH